MKRAIRLAMIASAHYGLIQLTAVIATLSPYLAAVTLSFGIVGLTFIVIASNVVVDNHAEQ